MFEIAFPIGFSTIDWEKVDNKFSFDMTFPEDIINGLQNFFKNGSFIDQVYILCDCPDIPVIKTDLYAIIKHIADVTCICPKMWFLSTSLEYVVEWISGKKTVGFALFEAIQQAKKLGVFLEASTSDISILSRENSNKILKLLKNKFGFKNLLVSWSNIPHKATIQWQERSLLLFSIYLRLLLIEASTFYGIIKNYLHWKLIWTVF